MGVFSDIVTGIGGAIAAPKVAREQRKGVREAQDLYQQGYEDVAGMYDPYQQAGQQSMAQLMSGMASGEFSPEMGDFQYDRSVSDFLDPNVDYQTQQANRALEQSAATGGQLRSGATLLGLQEQAQQFANQAYQQAYQNMMQDKSFAYNQFTNQFNVQAQNARNRQAMLQNMMSQGLGATGAVAGARQGLGQQQAQGAMQLADVSAQRSAAGTMMPAQVIGGIGDIGVAAGMAALGAPPQAGMSQIQGSTPMSNPSMVSPISAQAQQQYYPQQQGQGNIGQAQATMMGFNPNLPSGF